MHLIQQLSVCPPTLLSMSTAKLTLVDQVPRILASYAL